MACNTSPTETVVLSSNSRYNDRLSLSKRFQITFSFMNPEDLGVSRN